MIAGIVPAAGLSRRMGQPKLILPLADGRTVLATVLDALKRGGVEILVVVTPPGETALANAMRSTAAEQGASVVIPTFQPPDMRASVELGLQEILRGAIRPDTLLLCPADSPGISRELVSRVVARANAEPQAIVIPTFQGKRGHPVAIPWSLAESIPSLAEGLGVNALIKQQESLVVEIFEAEPRAISDMDTPEDYQRWSPETIR